MSEAKVADTKPVVITQEPGSYHWCACGESKSQPFCDGSHAGTEFSPLKYEISEEKKVALCTCKRTANPPFCDGAHKAL